MMKMILVTSKTSKIIAITKIPITNNNKKNKLSTTKI